MGFDFGQDALGLVVSELDLDFAVVLDLAEPGFGLVAAALGIEQVEVGLG